MKKSMRGPIIYIAVILAIIIITSSAGGMLVQTDDKEIEYSEFMGLIESGEITQISVTINDVYALKKGSTILEDEFPTQYDVSTYLPTITVFNDDLREIREANPSLETSMTVKYNPIPDPSFLEVILPYIPLVLVIGFFAYFMYRQSQGGGKAMNFGKSKARMTMGSETKKTFADVAGADEEKEELVEIVEFLKNPKKFSAMGARVPKGVLLVGPPGGGKTLLAKAVAGEAKVPFFSISGSDFVEMFVGVGASRVRDLFESAKKNAPSIVFIDEIDAVGRHRGAGLGGGHDEREQTLNQLLVEMDGFQGNEGVIVVAATNRMDILDPALLRAGRFDRQIIVNYPDVKGREEILKVHAKGKPISEGIDLKVLAQRTPGFIGADLENVLNEAAILTVRRGKETIGMLEVEEAITRVIAGPEKKSRVISEEDKRCTAYHEVGHAIVAKLLPGCDEVHEISIIPRGMAAGYTLTLPEKERSHLFRSKMKDEIAMMLGGRVAEALTLGDISTGASNDIERATKMASGMVVKYGMSEVVGPIFHGSEQQEVFLGRDFGHAKNYSEEVAWEIDSEIRKIINEGYEKAEKILKDNLDKLKGISEILLIREKIDGKEFERLLECSQGELGAETEIAKVEMAELKEKIEAQKEAERKEREEQKASAEEDELLQAEKEKAEKKEDKNNKNDNADDNPFRS